MGGYVNLVVRKENSITKTLSYTGCIPRLLNPDLYDGNETAIQSLLEMYGGCPEQSNIDGRILAPFNYGLIVVDFDTKTVFDMQNARCIYMASIGLSMHSGGGAEYLLEAGKRGLLGDRLYGISNEKELNLFPENLFESLRTMTQWCLRTDYERMQSIPQDPDGHFDLDFMTENMAGFKLSPPGWTFKEFDCSEGLTMRDSLLSAGFILSELEEKIWEEWCADHPVEMPSDHVEDESAQP